MKRLATDNRVALNRIVLLAQRRSQPAESVTILVLEQLNCGTSLGLCGGAGVERRIWVMRRDARNPSQWAAQWADQGDDLREDGLGTLLGVFTPVSCRAADSAGQAPWPGDS